MRNSISILTIAAALLIAGCGPEVEPEQAKFEVAPATLEQPAAGGQASFTVLSTAEDWMARVDKDWIKLLTVTAKASPDAVTVKLIASENTTVEARSATITVSTMSGARKTVTVAQGAGSGAVAGKGISTADELLAFAKAFNSGAGISAYKVDGEVKLMCDIDASSIKEWVPIGTKDIPFGETFNGGGHTIRNVAWTVDTDKYPFAGLIGYAKNAKVKNLTFGSEGSKVTVGGSGNFVGGIAGYAEVTTLTKVTNNATLSMAAGKNTTCIGGICGQAAQGTVMGDEKSKAQGCVNNGDLLVAFACHEGGLAGRCDGKIMNCTNNGAVLGKYAADGTCGPAWGCSYISKANIFTTNFGYGHVGDYDACKASPKSARAAVHATATVYPTANYDLTINTVDWTQDTYYDWETVEEKQLHAGVKYAHYNFTGMTRHMHVLEIDLSNPSVQLTTAFADECIPNPNGNGNSNNGKNIRETLSDVCNRRRSEGQNIIAGVNSGFFDSNDGIARGYHVEECEPVYVNNPDVSGTLGNHVWGITVFTDGTASCGKKALNAALEAAGKSYKICSVNDTILRHVSAKYAVNMYTSRYKQYPHPEKKTLTNALAANALYMVAEYTSDPVKVNAGWAEATVKSFHDGTGTKLTTLPYITSSKQVGFAISGTTASEILASVKVGDTIRLKVDMTIDGVAKPIFTQNSSMYKLMTDGEDGSNTPGSSASLYSVYDPMTFPVVSPDAKKVWLVEIDGRQVGYSIGVKGYEMYRIAKKLGGWNITRLDGGGSSCMWVYDSSRNAGGIVNRPSDAKGERSCLNYLLVRLK